VRKGPLGPSCHSGKNKTRPISPIVINLFSVLIGMRFIWMTLSNHDNVLYEKKRTSFNISCPWLLLPTKNLACTNFPFFSSKISFLQKRDKIYGASIFSRAAAIKNYCGCVQLSRGPKRNPEGWLSNEFGPTTLVVSTSYPVWMMSTLVTAPGWDIDHHSVGTVAFGHRMSPS